MTSPVQSLIRNLGICAAGLVGAGVFAVAVQPAQPGIAEQGHLADTGDLSGSTALIEQHNCWTGGAPADMEGKLPGHVVVTVGQRTTYAGPKMVALALDQIFNGHDHDLVVRGFCR